MSKKKQKVKVEEVDVLALNEEAEEVLGDELIDKHGDIPEEDLLGEEAEQPMKGNLGSPDQKFHLEPEANPDYSHMTPSGDSSIFSGVKKDVVNKDGKKLIGYHPITNAEVWK